MKSNRNRERVHFLQKTLVGLKRLESVYGYEYSRTCVSLMRQIIIQLRHELLVHKEQQIIDLEKKGMITPEKAQKKQLANKRNLAFKSVKQYKK